MALKIKEVSYIHAEGYNAGTFKHGPIAMIDSELRTPVIVIVAKDNFYDDMVSNYSQIKSRNATTILLTNCKDSLDTDGVDFIVEFPNDGLMSSFYAVFAGQMIAYYLALEKGFDPDKPRQLSKEITTK
jgi:glucosamine--fructose-6-phosphate aminotransferase (isomerizing)